MSADRTLILLSHWEALRGIELAAVIAAFERDVDIWVMLPAAPTPLLRDRLIDKLKETSDFGIGQIMIATPGADARVANAAQRDPIDLAAILPAYRTVVTL